MNRHYRENRDRRLAAQREYRQTHPEKRRAAVAKWDRANPDNRRAREAKRRARKRNAEGHFTDADIARLTILQRGRCANCKKKKPKRLCVDHIIPLALGGTNWPRNLQLLCMSCNSKKNAKEPLVFMREQGALL